MAVSKAKISVNLNKAADRAKGTEVDYGNIEMPEVRNGVAVLTGAEVKPYAKGRDKGKLFLSLKGTAISPEKNDNGERVKGLLTMPSGSLNLFPYTKGDEKISQEQAEDEVINEIRKLDVESFDALEDGVDIIEDYLPSLVESKPQFRFSVRVYQKKKRVNGKLVMKDGEPVLEGTGSWHNWHGSEGLDQIEVEDEEVEDETGEEEEIEADEVDENDEAIVEEDSEEEVDYIALAEAADEGDAEAANALGDAAEEAGIEDYNDLPTWAEVAQLLVGEESEEEETEEEGSEDWQPVEGDTVKYKPKGKKTAVKYKITSVDLEKETVNLKAVVGPGRSSNVAWDKLIVE